MILNLNSPDLGVVRGMAVTSDVIACTVHFQGTYLRKVSHQTRLAGKGRLYCPADPRIFKVCLGSFKATF